MARIEFRDLPPKYQIQVLEQIQNQSNKRAIASRKHSDSKAKSKPAKYRNKSVQSSEVIKFKSKLEKKRYEVLYLHYQNGDISDLKLQPSFTLMESYITPEGVKVGKLHYTADFSYILDGKLVVEDVKSVVTKTEAYGIRKTMMKDKYGIEIKEVYRESIDSL